MMHLKLLEKQEQTKSQTSRWREIIKVRAKIKEIKTYMCVCIYIINETSSWFFENINKINKPLARIIKQRREKTQINKIRDEKRRNNHKY
jgi:hypothetical protein